MALVVATTLYLIINFLAISLHCPRQPFAINSASMVECKMQVCFFETQLMAALPKVKIQAEVDLWSVAIVIQLAFVKPSRTVGNFL